MTRSFLFASQINEINHEMVYVIASYHDTAHHIDAKNHEKISAELLRNDKKLIQFFTLGQITIMSEAIEDHRVSSNKTPRNI